MADRFWVGGTGSWNTVLTTSWSATSGGLPGATAPGSADWAIFDANSGTGTVTLLSAVTPGIIAIRNCSALTVTGAFAVSTAASQPIYYGGGTFTFSNTSVSFPAGLVVGYESGYPAASGTLTFSNTTTCTFSGGGGASPFNVGIYFKSTGADVTIGNTTTVSIASIEVPATATGGTLSIQNPSTVTISGTVTYASTAALLKFTSAVTTVTMSGTNPLSVTGTAANIEFKNTTLYLTGSGNINANNCTMTCAVLKNTAVSHTLTGDFTTTGTVTQGGTLNIGNYILSCASVVSNGIWTFGTGAVYLTATSGTIFSVTGLAFDPGTSSNFVATANPSVGTTRTFAMTSPGAISANFKILAGSDSIVIGSTTRVNNLDFTGFSGTLGTTTTLNILGSLTLSSAMTIPDAATTITFNGTTATAQTITSNGVTVNRPITFNTSGTGGVSLADAFTTNRVVSLSVGKLALNGLTFTCSSFLNSGGFTRSIAWGTNGQITVTASGSAYTQSTLTGLTMTGTGIVATSNSGAVAVDINTGSSPASTQRFSLKTTGSGTFNLTLSPASCGFVSLDFTGHNGTVGATNALFIYGSLTLSSAASFAMTAAATVITFGALAAAGTQTITCNGKSIDRPITFDGVGGVWQLQDALTTGSTRLLSQTNGTVDLNGKTLTTGTYATVAGTKNLTFNGGTLAVTGSGATAFSNAVPAGFTTSSGIAKGFISMTSATAKTFAGGGSTYNATLTQAGAGALTVSGSNQFSIIKNTTQPAPIIFTSSTTNTFVDDFKLKGSAGSLIVITATTPGTAANVSHTGSNVSCDYISLKDNTATGEIPFYAGAHSTISTNVTGWSNRPPLSANTDFLMFF